MADNTPSPAESRLERKERIRSRENLEKYLLQQTVIKHLSDLSKDFKAEIHAVLENGETIRVTNERGVEIGSVYRTNPKPTFVIEDISLVLPQADESEIMDRLPEVDTEEYFQVLDLVAEHAPDLLATPVLTEQEEARLRDDVKKEWELTGNVAPGWRLEEGRAGYTAARTNDLGKELVARMLEGTKSALELTEGNDG